MALSVGLNKPFAARPAACRRSVAAVSSTQRVVLPAAQAAAGDKSVNVPAAVSAFAASLVLLTSAPAFAGTAGRAATQDLVDKGTPAAAKPDTMKTNVPFQAPGSNKSPRGVEQEQGTTPVAILKKAGKQIGKNSQDPESAPFGVGRGPLVRSAQKMGQPGKLGRFGNEATDILKGGNTVGNQKKESGISQQVDRGYYGVYDKVAGKK